MKTIFVAIDLGSSIENILEAAREMAKVFEAELVLATVESELPGSEGAEEEVVVEDLEQTYGKEVHELQALAQGIASEGIACRALILEGVTANQLVQAANDMNADMIILGNHGHSPMYDTLIGGTAPGVIQKARQKVLLVPVDG